MEPLPPIVRIAMPALLLVVGVLFVLFGVVRPEWIWSLGKIQAGRRALGDSGTAVFLIGMGIVLCCAAVAIGIKLRVR
ncbi:MAG: hypothetical protein JNM40_01365 [Myxococcales bacterium]|nr:hypothetical protein [Myxococcales bacterium]